MFGMLLTLWRYRGFVLSSIRNEFVSRFARSRIGGLWMVIHPLTQVAIFALVLSNVLAARLPGTAGPYGYALYLLAGILAWNLFAEIVSRCLTLFIDNGNLIKKILFPKIALPAIAVGACLLNNLVLFAAIVVVFLLLGHRVGPEILLLAPVALVLLVFALGLGLVLGVLNVFIRDIGQAVPILLQLGFWMTPIVYPASVVPEAMRPWLALNPMQAVAGAYHDLLVFGRIPAAGPLLVVGAAGLALLVLGLFMIRRASAEMVDAL